MKFRHGMIGFILSAAILSLSFLFEELHDFCSLIHLLITFVFICTLAAVAGRRKSSALFMGAYIPLAIPSVFSFLCMVAVNLEQLDIAFFQSSGFEDFIFLLMLLGMPAVLSIIGTVRVFYNPDFSGFDIKDILFTFIITAILLLIPLVIYKFTKKSDKENISQ